MMVGVLILVRASQRPQIRLKFDQIECSMTRKQVQELMRDIDPEMAAR
jgi:hypothetical protein